MMVTGILLLILLGLIAWLIRAIVQKNKVQMIWSSVVIVGFVLVSCWGLLVMLGEMGE